MIVKLQKLCFLQLIDCLNKYGFCLESSKKYTILEDIGKHYLNQAIELVRTGHRFVYVLDNIDWEEKAHDVRKDARLWSSKKP